MKLKYIFLLSLIVSVFSCGNNLPLDEIEFQSLLLEMHKYDGIFKEEKKNNQGLDNTSYYVKLFNKYGITEAEFDSCMYHYSGNVKQFDKMYDFIVDSLNKELTDLDLMLKELKSKDTINLFPTTDTLFLDTVKTIVLDSLIPGMYKFSCKIQCDSVDKNRLRRIEGRFISSDDKDTLLVKTLSIAPDTIFREYSWGQYIDSLYTRVEFIYLNEIPFEERPRIYSKGKWKEPSRKVKAYSIQKFKPFVFDNSLYRVYRPVSTQKRLKRDLENKRKQ